MATRMVVGEAGRSLTRSLQHWRGASSSSILAPASAAVQAAQTQTPTETLPRKARVTAPASRSYGGTRGGKEQVKSFSESVSRGYASSSSATAERRIPFPFTKEVSALGAFLAAGFVGSTLVPEVAHTEEEKKKPWPVFTRDDVAKHNKESEGVWIIHGSKVYDITEFVQNHPGGVSKIMLAAGKSVEPFWQIYQQHLGNQAVQDILGELQVGELDAKDVAGLAEELDTSDPYSKEPPTHPALSVHYSKPVNAEIPPTLLMDSWITPNDLWYVRHHHPVPVAAIDASSPMELTMEVCLGGKLEKSETITLEDLKRKFKKREIVATMQCGGNRRSGLNGVDDTKGTSWDVGAISNAKWGGVLLKDVLSHMGIHEPEDAEKRGIKHVQFESHDGMTASIPIEKVLNPYGDVLVAYEMNGVDIPKSHGYPLRAIVPGVVGVRNVKWLKSITLSDEESKGPWQRGMNYKVFSPSVKDLNTVDIASVPTIQEQPVQSVIVSPQDRETIEIVPGEDIDIKGYAWSGGGRGIIRVDVSIDSGKNWHTAQLKEGSEQNPSKAWAWTFWEVSIPAPEGKEKVDIVCKATDYAHNCQPETPASIWNLRGLNNNCWHHVHVNLDDVTL